GRREGVRQRGKEGRMLRLIGKWWRAGVRAAGALTPPETGVGQGGGSAHVLAPGFLHEVLAAWWASERRPRRQGHCFLRRFAEACVIGGARAEEAPKIRAVRPQRLARCGRP